MARPKSKSRSDHEHALTGEKLTLLAVFANPEEEVFGPVGTLAKYASEGVHVLTVTASRETALAPAISPLQFHDHIQAQPREQLCSCATYGTERICLLDRAPSRAHLAEEATIVERLVRFIREQRPQVIVSYGPEGMTGDPEHILIGRLATRAFHEAGDAEQHTQHIRDGLYPFQPKKLYYSVLPQSFLKRLGIEGLVGVPDDQVTTVLDVSLYSEGKLKTLYCQRTRMLDYASWLSDDSQIKWDEEYFALAASNLRRRPRKEDDLFAGLR